MKKKINFSITLLMLSVCMYAQDVFNPYKFPQLFPMPAGIPMANFQYPPSTGGPPNPNGFLYTPQKRRFIHSSEYTGEYMIMLENHPWNSQGRAVTYKIEVVSFPFTVDCWDTNPGCSFDASPPYGGLNERIFFMPDDPYNSSTNKWGNLYREYSGNFSGNPLRSQPASLISYAFVLPMAFVISPNSQYYPHTVLKQTMEIHCTSSPTSDVMSRYSFIYDNTRGRMSYYPFQGDNHIAPGVPSEIWDVIFRPEILVDPDQANGYTYNKTSNSGWFEGGGTINYFPYSEISSPCGGIPNILDEYVSSFSPNTYNPNELLPDQFNFVFPAPYTLTSTFLRDNSGTLPAGYQQMGGANSNATERPGVPHAYRINTNIDLSLINPTEMIIYNPSEVTAVYQGQIIFPDNYVFKTARGKYPTSAEVNAANTSANCGPYSDLRQVPVPTDVSLTGDPNDASIYHIESGSTIVVNPCVKIFDATFDVLAGGALTFMNRSTNCGRWKMQNAGTVTEKSSTAIFLQNKIISQGKYQYESKTYIKAGNNVDPNQAVGDYVVNSGGEVVTIAENYVTLLPGFAVNTGGKFSASIASVTSPLCNARIKNTTAGTKEPQKDSPSDPADESRLLVAPNPSEGVIRAMIFDTDKNIDFNLTVTNMMGQQVYSLAVKPLIPYEIDLASFAKGIYYIKAQSLNKVLKEKIIVQ